jgi:hypothetical protein
VTVAVEVLAALLLGFTLIWIVFEPLVGGHRRPESLSPDPPELEATAHGAALIALKDLELDYATGKLSASDYDELRVRFTAAAVASLRQTGPDGPSCPSCGPRSEQDAVFCSECGRPLG